MPSKSTNTHSRRPCTAATKCEHAGRYFAEYYQQLAAEPSKGGVDFRCIRFPGLISADTAPAVGPLTSDLR